MALSAGAGSLAAPRPARAADAVVSWKPRRHHRHIGERFTDRWADAVAEAEESGRERVRDLERRLAAANARADGEAATRKAAEARLRAIDGRGGGAGAGGRASSSSSAYASGDEWPVALRVLGADATPLLLAGAVAFAWWRAHASGALAQWTGGRLGGRRRRGKAGRWVYDRSLGGRRVWVPADVGDEDGLSPGGGGGGGGWRGGGGAAAGKGEIMSAADFDALAARAATASVSAAAGGGAFTASPNAPSSRGKQQPPPVPAWWESAQPARLAGLDAASKAEARGEARRLLGRLEQAKNAGEDYPLAALLALRRACQQAGTAPAGEALVEPRTVGGRDALYRAAVDAAVLAAGEPGAVDLGGEDPLRLCAGVAGDLGVADARAVSLLRGRLAGAARARVVEAIAALGRGDGDGGGSDSDGDDGRRGADGDALVALAKLSALLEGLPGVLGGEAAPSGHETGDGQGQGAAAGARSSPVAPEVELVAGELNAWAPVAARERVLALFCQVDPQRAALVARLLDFDPAVALPRVASRLDAAWALDGAEGGPGGA